MKLKSGDRYRIGKGLFILNFDGGTGWNLKENHWKDREKNKEIYISISLPGLWMERFLKLTGAVKVKEEK